MSDAPLQIVALALFAEINARADNGELRASILSEKGLTEAEFAREQERWLSLIASQAQQQRWQLQQRYSTMYTQWRLKDNPSKTPYPPPPLWTDQPLYGRTSLEAPPASPPANLSASPSAQVGAAPPFLEQPRPDGRRDAYGSNAGLAGLGAAPASPTPRSFPTASEPATPAFLAPAPSPAFTSAPAFTSGPAFISGPAAHGLTQAPEVPTGAAHASPTAGPLFVSPSRSTPMAAPATPAFLGPPLSFEQLTCLTAELDVKPDMARATLAGYGIDQSGYDAQRQALTVRCQADPELQLRYERLLQYYRKIVSQR